MPKYVLAAFVAAVIVPRTLPGQGETTSAISGLVNDETGSGIPGADITAVSEENGQKRRLRADQAGRFAFPQLKPGSYTVEASAPQFRPQRKSAVAAGLGQTQTVNFTLSVASIRGDITVNSEAPLLNTQNPNTSTTLSARAMEDLPNPGGDLTYPLQFAAGALINTAGSSNDFVGGSNGFGNVEFNGLPALANGYIVDGLETNDPLTNLNSGLSTNLVLGLNSIAEVTVNTLSYAVDQGRYGASQVNYVTKSGTNQFHGSLHELWNGARFNAADFFTNSTSGSQKPRSTVNHFGGSVGGPIRRNKLFFFFDSEWVRIALPIVSAVMVPTPQLESYILQQLPIGGRDVVTGATYPAQPQLIPFYRRLFSLYSSASGVPVPLLGCPFTNGGSPAGGSPPNGDGCALRRSVSQSSADHEQVQTVRVDYNAATNDILWVRVQADTGLQAAYTDPINPAFDAVSSQPLYSFASGYTHVFSSHLVNYFNPAFSWYESLFGPTNLQQTLAAFPIVLEGSGGSAPFTMLGGQDNTWIQGRRASRFFINDNLAWTAGAHDLRFGTNTRILRLNDYDFGEGTTPTVTYTDLPQFIYGVASTATTTFPVAYSQPFNFLNVDLYAQDTWKLTGRLTWTLGVRATHNSNPLNP
ncbi:MAG TPA: carboxypeptidase regulatory-like domain-containing protein, partial [Bryobacteraceae bacterium]